jgi:hypothetical protein
LFSAWKKKKLPFCAKIWHSNAIIDIQDLMHIFGGGVVSMDCHVYIPNKKSKKGEIESASRLLVDFGD